jgi:hypothetical protein
MDRLTNFFWGPNSDAYARRIWFAFFALIALLVFFQPAQRTVTHNYSRAAYSWWKSENMYSLQGKGFSFSPSSPDLHTFRLAGIPAGFETVQQTAVERNTSADPSAASRRGFLSCVLVGLFGWAIWRICRLFRTDAATASLFCLVTLLALPASLTAGRNGQFNMLLSATMNLAAVSISEKRWRPATAWLVLGVIAKPLGLVPLLLLGVLYRPLWWRLPLGMLLFAGLSFVHYDPTYVLNQWQMCFKQVTMASIPPGNNYDDIAGMFRALGWMCRIKNGFPSAPCSPF